jgi:transposase InsO family protein
LAQQPGVHVAELCRRFEISPKTGYKWINRYRQHGEAGLLDQFRRPLNSPSSSLPALEPAVLALHETYPAWGSRKLRSLLPDTVVRPHHSTIEAILRRHGRPLRYGTRPDTRAPSRFEREAPNELWQIDFKGHFALFGQSARCHPLTLLDDHSRFALCLADCADEQRQTVQQQLIRVFRRYGLPRRITSDNGPLWGALARAGLSALQAWLMCLGIRVSHSKPYHPRTQGKLERFHQTLKRELLHDAHFTYPETLPPVEYEPGERVLKVRSKGQIHLKGRAVFISEGLAGEYVAVRPANQDGFLDIIFINKTVRQIETRSLS